MTLFRRRGADRFDIVPGMDAGDRRKVGARGEVARQHLIGLALERALDRAQPIGTLGMALAHLMRQAGRVTDDERSQGVVVLLRDLRFPGACAALLRQREGKSMSKRVNRT